MLKKDKKSTEKIEKDTTHISPVYAPQIKITHGSNDSVFDEEGNEYIDFTSGIAVNAFGHRSHFIASDIVEQLQTLTHVSNLYVTQPQISLCNKLVKLANKSFRSMEYSSAFLSNSGTEANEAALKFALLAKSRQVYRNDFEIISCNNSFHGRSLGSLSVTGQVKYRNDFLPYLNSYTHFIDYNDAKTLSSVVSEKTVAIILEVVQGEGGLEILSKEFAQKVMELSERYKFYIIIDEVQTGLYRTGTLFASQRYPIAPHLITLSKALGGGMPLGATITCKEIHQLLKVGDHGSTTGGSPISCTAALSVLKKMHSLEFHIARRVSLAALNQEIKSIQKKIPKLILIGKGHLLGLSFPQDVSLQVGDVIQEAKEKGLLILRTGKNSIRIAPALICSPSEIKKGMRILYEILKPHFMC